MLSPAEIPAPRSPLPSLAAFGVLDFVHTPAPSSQAGGSCSERLSKATLSCLLPAPCLEHTLIFLLSNGSSSSVQPQQLQLHSAAAPLSLLGDQDLHALSCCTFSPLGSVCFPRGGIFTCRFLALPEPCFPVQQWVLLSQGCLELGGG